MARNKIDELKQQLVTEKIKQNKEKNKQNDRLADLLSKHIDALIELCIDNEPAYNLTEKLKLY